MEMLLDTQTGEMLLERVQLSAARGVTGGMRGTPNHQLYIETGWEMLKSARASGKKKTTFNVKKS